jgi:hypothetical protein
MPFSAPGSLTDEDVYSVVTFVLSEAKVIKSTNAVNAQTLPEIAMPKLRWAYPRCASEAATVSEANAIF